MSMRMALPNDNTRSPCLPRLRARKYAMPLCEYRLSYVARAPYFARRRCRHNIRKKHAAATAPADAEFDDADIHMSRHCNEILPLD